MKFFFTGLLLTTLLCIGSAYCYVCLIKGHCNSSSKEKILSSAELKSVYSTVIDFEENVLIYKDDPSVNFSNADFSKTKQLVSFCKSYPESIVTVKSFFAPDEGKPANADNMGLARGEEFRKMLVEAGVPEDRIKVEAVESTSLFDDSGKATGEDAIDFDFSNFYPALNNLELKAGYRQLINLEKLFHFRKNDSIMSQRKEYAANLEEVQFYMNRNKDIEMITSNRYQKDELGVQSHNDIGSARGNSFKGILSEMGIDPNRIKVTSQSGKELFNDLFQAKAGSFEINFKLPDPSDTSYAKVKALEQGLQQSLNKKEKPKGFDQSVDIRFQMGRDRLYMNPEIENFVRKLKLHLETNPDQKVYITGHTCDVGSDSFNKILGFNRAGSAMLMLKDHGVNEEQIEFTSMGEEQPAYSNDNEANRNKNRRIEIEIN